MNSGDKVELQTEKSGVKQTLVGTLLPRPELFDQNIIVLKLENGYNVGVDKSTIKSKKVLQPYKPIQEPLPKVKENPNLPTVAFLSTGGTISSRIDYKSGGVIADYGAEEFQAMMPELASIANIKAKKISSYMSEDIALENLSQIAKDIKPYLEDEYIKGIVVTSGTDMMHYISAGLSFIFTKLNKPIIITGAQRSIDRGSSDAFENVICATIAATKWDAGEIAICMHETSDDGSCILSRGTKVRKMHTSRRDAFRPINEQPIARVKPTGEFEIINNRFEPKAQIFQIKPDMETKVGMIYIHPNVNPKLVNFFIKEKYKGLVIGATAFGHVPNHFYDAVQKAKDAGIVVVIASQTIYGRVHPYVYTNLRKLSIDIDVSFMGDATLETIFMKLAWVLGNTTPSKDNKEAISLMQQNLRNEFSEELDERGFLR